MDAEVGKAIVLDASHSRDPDGQHLHYSWFQYGEAGVTGENAAAVNITSGDTAVATVTVTAVCRPLWLPIVPCQGDGTAHIILAVSDDGSPSLTSYRRVILKVRGLKVQGQAPGRRDDVAR
jgi:hypothetical protein